MKSECLPCAVEIDTEIPEAVALFQENHADCELPTTPAPQWERKHAISTLLRLESGPITCNARQDGRIATARAITYHELRTEDAESDLAGAQARAIRQGIELARRIVAEYEEAAKGLERALEAVNG